MMYERVKTKRQQRGFKIITEYFCDKYDWYNAPNVVDGRRYNILPHKKRFYQRKKVIGTIEIIPCKTISALEGLEKTYFSQLNDVIPHQNKTWQIDKLCLHENYQRQGYFQIFFQIIFEHATENGAKYYLSTIESKLFRFLRISLGSAVEKRGNAIVGATTVLIPALINIEQLLKDQDNVKRLLGKKALPLLGKVR